MFRSAPLAFFSHLPGRCFGGNEDQQNCSNECPEGCSLPQIERGEQRAEVGNKAGRYRVEDRGRNDDKQKPSHERSNDAPLPPIERASPVPAPYNEANQMKPIVRFSARVELLS